MQLALDVSPLFHRGSRPHRALPFSFVRRGRKRLPLSAMLNLNPLIGVLLVLLIFLLPQFNASGELLCVCRHPPLPRALNVAPLSQGLVVTVTTDSVVLNGDPKAATQELLSDPAGGVIQPLYDDLVVLKKNHQLLHFDEAVFPGIVNIAAEKHIAFRILRGVLATCKAAGYDQPSFVVETVPEQWLLR